MKSQSRFLSDHLTKKHLRLGALLATAVAAGLGLDAHAASGTFNNPAGGSWGTAGNWTGGIPQNFDDTADFSTLNLTGDATVTLEGSRTVGTMIFGDTTPGNNWIINNGAGTNINVLTLDGTTPTVTVNNGIASINSAFGSGTNGLTKAGLGTLVFNGNYVASAPGVASGNWNVNAGVLQLNNFLLTQDPTIAGGISGPATGFTIAGGATVRMTGTLSIQGSGNDDTSFINGAGTLQLRDGATSSALNPSIIYGIVPNSNAEDGVFIDTAVALGNNGSHWITGQSNHNEFSVHNGDLIFTNSLSGAAGITLAGKPFGDPYSLVFSGDNSAWTGALTLVEGSFVPFDTGTNVKAIGANNAVVFNPGAGQDARFYLYGQDVTIGSLSSTGTAAGTMSIRNAEWTTDGGGSQGSHSHVPHLTQANLFINQTVSGTFAGILEDGPSDRAPDVAV